MFRILIVYPSFEFSAANVKIPRVSENIFLIFFINTVRARKYQRITPLGRLKTTFCMRSSESKPSPSSTSPGLTLRTPTSE